MNVCRNGHLHLPTIVQGVPRSRDNLPYHDEDAVGVLTQRFYTEENDALASVQEQLDAIIAGEVEVTPQMTTIHLN